MNATDPSKSEPNKPILVIVTGLSGAGKSTAINALEDIGFYCIDNLPSALWQPTLEFISKSTPEKKLFAIGIDVRDQAFDKLLSSLTSEAIAKLGIEVDILFVTADEDALLNRFNTTRRKHPLLDVGGELLASIRRERELLRPIEQVAKVGFDTTWWSPHQLARAVEQRYGDKSLKRHLHVTITSFGFKYGPLRNADLIYDVRFLVNPHFVPALKPRTGQDKAVREHIFASATSREFFAKLLEFNSFMLPLHYQEGKHYLRIGIGCTGGKHRSVCMAESLGKELAETCSENMLFSVHHRDLEMHGQTIEA